MKINYVIGFFMLVFCKLSYGQLVTSPGSSPSSLVQNVLLGPGVTVSNISYNGSGGAISSFTANGSNLGISSGIVMTTGTVYNNGSGPQGPNNQANSGVDNQAGGSSLLANITGGASTFNAAILEFDFVPYSDTVRFRYVFGSEEYPEYAPPNNSDYNDVFGFFIAGPGISGVQNIARLPSGSIVSINNVNQITNSSYYNNNGNGNSSPQNGSAYYVQYDGFTDVLEAVARVQCGQTYHLILAIADVGDPIYDSGIFLEANSLTSKVPVEITYELSAQNYADPDIMSEGCVSATVTLERGTNNLNTTLTIPINVSGTATEGMDYTNIPNSVTFAPGQTMIQFSLDAFADLLTEGQETIVLEFPLVDPCGNITPVIIDLGIEDVQPVAVTVESNTVLCPGDDVQLEAVATGGGAPYTYLWNTGETSETIMVSPTSSQTYTVTVTDNCLNETATGSGTVNVPVYPPLVLEETDDITEICPYIPTLLEVTATGGAGDYTYQWSTNSGQLLGNDFNQVVTPPATTTYIVEVTDQCGVVSTASVLYTITSPPLLLQMSPGVEICPGDSVLLSVMATGGYGQYFYSWPQTGETTPQIWVNPMQTTNYQVVVSDECQTFTVDGFTPITVVRPTANFNVSSNTIFNNLPITFQNTSINAVSYEWQFGDGDESTVVHPNHTYEDPRVYYVTLIATDALGCVDTIVKPLQIMEEWYIYVPNTFTPEGMLFNNTFKVSTIGIQTFEISIYNRWGEEIYNSRDKDFEWDGTYDGKNVQDGTYNWKIDYVTNEGFEDTITGHINVLR